MSHGGARTRVREFLGGSEAPAPYNTYRTIITSMVGTIRTNQQAIEEGEQQNKLSTPSDHSSEREVILISYRKSMSKPPPFNPYAKKTTATTGPDSSATTTPGIGGAPRQDEMTAPISISALGALPLGAMNASNTSGGLRDAIKYIDMFFVLRGVTERFGTLRDDDVEGGTISATFLTTLFFGLL